MALLKGASVTLCLLTLRDGSCIPPPWWAAVPRFLGEIWTSGKMSFLLLLMELGKIIKRRTDGNHLKPVRENQISKMWEWG